MDSKHSLPELVEILEYANYISIREREEIAELIQQQDKMIELACEWIADHTGECPIGLDYVQWKDCDVRCTTNDNQEAICWRKYLQSEVSK